MEWFMNSFVEIGKYTSLASAKKNQIYATHDFYLPHDPRPKKNQPYNFQPWVLQSHKISSNSHEKQKKNYQ